eukprot:1266437-Pleurochrysis_carterae.AAC.2
MGTKSEGGRARSETERRTGTEGRQRSMGMRSKQAGVRERKWPHVTRCANRQMLLDAKFVKCDWMNI